MKYDPRCSSRIPDPMLKKAPDPGSGSATLISCSQSEHACSWHAVLRIRIRSVLGLLDPDPLVRGTDLDLDPSIIKQK
jgi:hypothetical protein